MGCLWLALASGCLPSEMLGCRRPWPGGCSLWLPVACCAWGVESCAWAVASCAWAVASCAWAVDSSALDVVGLRSLEAALGDSGASSLGVRSRFLAAQAGFYQNTRCRLTPNGRLQIWYILAMRSFHRRCHCYLLGWIAAGSRPDGS